MAIKDKQMEYLIARGENMSRRAANGEGTLRLRKDGRWEYMVVVGYDALQKPIRKSFYAKSKTEAKRKYKEWLQKPANVKIEKVKTVGEWALAWLDIYKKDKVEYNTYKNYEMYVKNHIIPEIGNLKFEQVKPAHLERLMKKKANLSKSARHHIKVVLNGIFETAIDNNFCISNPCRKLSVGHDTKSIPEVFSAREIKDILNIAPTVPDGYVVELLLYTGLRLGEAAGLQWGDIDSNSQIITIRRSIAKKEGGGYEAKSTKSGKERYIGINDKLKALLERIPRNGLYVLARDSSEMPNICSLGLRYAKAMKSINEMLPPENKVRELTPHKCRHTYATYLLKGGANLRQVQHLLGHSSTAVTEIYTHVDTEDIKNSVTKLPY